MRFADPNRYGRRLRWASRSRAVERLCRLRSRAYSALSALLAAGQYRDHGDPYAPQQLDDRSAGGRRWQIVRLERCGPRRVVLVRAADSKRLNGARYARTELSTRPLRVELWPLWSAPGSRFNPAGLTTGYRFIRAALVGTWGHFRGRPLGGPVSRVVVVSSVSDGIAESLDNWAMRGRGSPELTKPGIPPPSSISTHDGDRIASSSCDVWGRADSVLERSGTDHMLAPHAWDISTCECEDCSR